jgi:hypothetical protein
MSHVRLPNVLTSSAVPCALVLAILMIAATWARTRGDLTYSLDDPYIHLTLARNIFHGNYGINPGEYASPSSSILWPFLLAPFSALPFAVWVPLAINVVCYVCTAQVLYAFIKRDVPGFAAIAIVLLLTFAFNLLSLMMMGMEHSLQALLVAAVAVEVLKERPSPLLFYAAAIALPLVRYEDLAITLPALAYCYARGMRRGPVVAAIVIIALVGGFSIFIHRHGLAYLPSSVLAKLDPQAHPSVANTIENTVRNFRFNFTTSLAHSLIVLFVAMMFFRLPKRVRPIALLLIVPTVIVYAFGKSGWLDRYQIHILIYGFVMSWELARRLPIPSFGQRYGVTFAVLLVCANIGFVYDTLKSPLASKNIHDQQYQLATIVRDFLREPVAVNDLGMVSYYGREPVLDLWGLGSIDALRARIADPSGGWVGAFMQRKGVEFAFIYQDWFPKLPATWIKVGTLSLPGPMVSAASTTVQLFATNEAAASRLRAALERYRASSSFAQQVAGQP